MASDNVFDICQCKFPLPVVIKWNLFYDAIKNIFLCFKKVINAFENLKRCKLKLFEWNFLEEYV